MEVRILGPLQIGGSDGEVQLGPKERVVLARLAAAGGNAVSDDALMELLWADELPLSARKGLNGYAYRLRKLLGEDAIVRMPGGYSLGPCLAVDLALVEAAAETARVAYSENRLVVAAELYRDALAYFRGEALPELADDDTGRIVRRQARELELCLAEESVEVDIGLGRYGPAVARLEQVVATDPTRERSWAQLAIALAATGRQADALDALARAKRALAVELGVEPGPRLREVEQAVLSQSLPYAPGRFATRTDLRPSVGRTPFPSLLSPRTRLSYVGREDLMAHLQEVRRQASEGSGRAVLLTGEPGVGKTRTAAEVAAVAYDEGALVLYGHCDEDVTAPYQPFVEALDWYTLQDPTPALGGHAGELSRLLPFLPSRVPGLSEPVSSDARSQEYLLFEATTSWLLDLARRQSLVLVFDDLHWSSKPTLMMLRHVLRIAAFEEDVRLLVLGTYRDTDLDGDHPLAGAMADLRRLSVVEQLAVEPLSPAEVGTFVARVAGADLDALGDRLAQSLHRETEGNVFFLSEVLRHLSETGAARVVDGGWVVAGEASAGVPPSVRDVVGQRLGRLPSDVRRLLGLASVLGRHFDVELLVALSETPEGRLLDALDEAVRARLIEESAADRYRFAHALVRATLVDDLSATRRRRIHRRAAEALEKLRPNDIEELAHHFAEAGSEEPERRQAIRYGLAAAERALEARAPADAEGRFRAVLDLIADSGDDQRRARVSALCGLGEAQRDQGDPTYRQTLLEAGHLAEGMGDVALLVRATLMNSRGVPSIIGGTDADRIAMTETALMRIGPEPSAERARLLAHLAAEVTFTPGHARRLALADEAEEMARQLGDPNLLAWVLNRTGYAAFSAERVERFVARGEEATELSDAGGDPTQRVLSRFFWSGALLTQGELDAFRHVTQDMLLVSAKAAPTLQWLARAAQARLHLLDGDGLAVERVNDDAFQLAQQLGEPDGPAWWAAILCPLLWSRAEYAGVPELLRAGIALYPDEPAWRIGYAMCLAMLGEADEAREVLGDRLPDPCELLDHAFPFFNILMVAVIAFHLGDAQLAARTAEALRPFGHCFAHQYAGSLGRVSLGLALCAAVTGDLDEAVALCEETEQALVASAVRNWLPLVRIYHAEIRRRRGAPHDHRLAGELVDRARQDATDMNAPRLVALADDLVSRLSAGGKAGGEGAFSL